MTPIPGIREVLGGEASEQGFCSTSGPAAPARGVLGRARYHERPPDEPTSVLLLPFARLAIASELGYYGSLQAWSRVDFLMARDRAQFGRLLAELKSTPSSARQHELLEQVCGLDGETFDAEWRKWVLATYR